MADLSLFWLRAATVLYSVGFLYATSAVAGRPMPSFPLAYGAFRTGFILHVVAMVELAAATGTFPAHNFFETASVCALLVAAVFLFVYWRYGFQSLSVFLFPLVFALCFAAGMGARLGAWTTPGLRDAWLLTHVVLVLAGYAAMLMMAVASLFYLVQERHLKSKKPRRSFAEKIPALSTLDSLMTRSMAAGFLLITLATITGVTWAFIENGTAWIREAKIVISFATWAAYLTLVSLRIGAGWRGRKAAILSLVVLGCSVATWAAHVGLRPLLER